MTISAIAVKSGMKNSLVATGIYTINYNQVATPTFSPGAGGWTSDQSVTISCDTADAIIYYTTDGVTTPTTSSTQYTGAISVACDGTTMTIQAIAVKSGMADSAVASGTWTITYYQLAAPVFSPSAQTYATDQTVTIGPRAAPPSTTRPTTRPPRRARRCTVLQSR